MAVTQPNLNVNQDKTSKSGRSSKDVSLESSSPTGHEEIEEQMAVESQGKGSPPEPERPTKEVRQARKEQEPDQPLNPRRQKNADPN